MSDLDLDELRAELAELAPAGEEGRPPAARGAHHRGLRGNSAVRREARPRPAAWRRPRHFRAALCRAPRPPARAGGMPFALLAPLDHQGLAGRRASCRCRAAETIDDDELARRTGGAAGAATSPNCAMSARSAEKRAAEEIANREKCEDFERFKPLFEQVQKEIESGHRGRARHDLSSEGRNQAGQFSSSVARWPMSRRWARRSQTRRARRMHDCA